MFDSCCASASCVPHWHVQSRPQQRQSSGQWRQASRSFRRTPQEDVEGRSKRLTCPWVLQGFKFPLDGLHAAYEVTPTHSKCLRLFGIKSVQSILYLLYHLVKLVRDIRANRGPTICRAEVSAESALIGNLHSDNFKLNLCRRMWAL